MLTDTMLRNLADSERYKLNDISSRQSFRVSSMR